MTQGNHLARREESQEGEIESSKNYSDPNEGFKYFVGIEIGVYLKRDPFFTNTADNLSKKIKRKSELRLVTSILDTLVEKGIMDKIGDFSATYSLNSEASQTIEYFRQVELTYKKIYR